MLQEESALIVPVPETEPVVGPIRRELDENADKGVPAHVTVLFPFLPPEEITDEVRGTLRELFSGYTPFEVAFTEVRWFGDQVAWLAPEPDLAFRQLTTAVWNCFPETPPYAGKHAGDHPHLTLGHKHPPEVLQQAATAVTPALPIPAAIGSVHLITGSSAANSWRTLEVFTLGNQR